VAGLIFLVAGCNNKDLAVVEGNVTVGGKPADEGSITFMPADGQGPSIGAQINNGKYRFAGNEGLPPGAKSVAITAMLKTGRQIPSSAMGAPEGAMIDEADRFSTKETCNITVGQVNRVDFDLKPIREKPRNGIMPWRPIPGKPAPGGP
jgi:hypothetical protein